MKIYTLWKEEDEHIRWLAEAIDGNSLDAGGGDSYHEAREKDPTLRELVIDIPDGAVAKLFAVPTVKGKVAP